MNENRLRNVIRKMLLENEGGEDLGYNDSYYTGGGGGDNYGSGPRATLLKIFWKPFADAAKAVRLSAQDILNVLRLTVATAFSLSPADLKNARDKYNTRKKALESEWAPILQSSYGAMANPDFGLVALAFAPQVFFAGAIIKAGYAAPGQTLEFFEKSGWLDFDIIPDDWKRAASSDEKWRAFTEKQRRKIKSGFSGGGSGGGGSSGGTGDISEKLRSFFFGTQNESARKLIDQLILEAEGSSTYDKMTPDAFFKSPIGEAIIASVAKATESARKSVIEAKSSQADEIIAKIEEKLRDSSAALNGPISDAFRDAKNFRDLEGRISAISGEDATKNALTLIKEKKDEATKKIVETVKEKKSEIEKEYNLEEQDKSKLEEIKKSLRDAAVSIIKTSKEKNDLGDSVSKIIGELSSNLSELEKASDAEKKAKLEQVRNKVIEFEASKAESEIMSAYFTEMKNAFLKVIPSGQAILSLLRDAAESLEKELMADVQDKLSSENIKPILDLIAEKKKSVMELANKIK